MPDYPMRNETLSRRRFLGASMLLAAFSGCTDRNTDSRSLKEKMRPIEMTSEEFKLLEDVKERARTVGEGPLTITGKLLGPPHRLDNLSLTDVHFVDCDFLGHYMFKVNLTNVTFTRCAIAGVRWEDGQWNDVSFIECVGKGRENNIIAGAGTGKMVYDRCQFTGDAPPDPSYNDFTEIRGGIGGAGKTRFTNCEFTRMKVRLVGEGEFKSCKLLSVVVEPARDRIPIERLLIEDSSCTYTLDLSNRPINSVTIKNGSFHQIDLSVVKANSVFLENISGNVDISGLDAGKFHATNCTFRAATNELDKVEFGGLPASLSRIDDMVLVNCKFEGARAILQAEGDPPQYDKGGKLVPRFNVNKQLIPYFNEWGTVALKNTPLNGANLTYSHIKELTIDGAEFSDSRLPHNKIGKLVLKNVKLSGSLDFTDTQVKEVITENVTKSKLSIVKDQTSEINL
jgi:uncharacterized protein YjbI with pentapeptide repeats